MCFFGLLSLLRSTLKLGFGLGVVVHSILQYDKTLHAQNRIKTEGWITMALFTCIALLLLWRSLFNTEKTMLRNILISVYIMAFSWHYGSLTQRRFGILAFFGWSFFFHSTLGWVDQFSYGARLLKTLRAALKPSSSLQFADGDALGHQQKVSPAHKKKKQKRPHQQQQHSAENSQTLLVKFVEGNIASGKSSLARDVLRYDTPGAIWSNSGGGNDDVDMRTIACVGGDTIDVYREQLAVPLHAGFVKEPAKYGFTLQMVMCERRVASAVNAMQRARNTGRHALIDRSVFGDFAFAGWNYVLGAISEAEFDIYRTTYGSTPIDCFERAVCDEFYNVDIEPVIVYLYTPADICHKRLQSRFGIDQGTSVEYLRGISIMHMLVLAHVAAYQTNAKVMPYNGAARISGVYDLRRFLATVKSAATGGMAALGHSEKATVMTCETVLSLPRDDDGGACVRFEKLLKLLFHDSWHSKIAAKCFSGADNSATLTEARCFAFLLDAVQKQQEEVHRNR